ncbi:putative disrupter of telomere silencing protein [Diplodia seriata]|uniref:thioredoxin-dependent peroxiredoxin n=1 Tax=Diplodia seriata TaxID=420778 RepID=A0A0G2GBK7_9PEZI|nr:putative disrupter of telomere silencing protein [Diplodia seriata]
MVELRKRKTPPPAPEKAAKRKPGPKSKTTKAKAAAADAVETAAAKVEETVNKVEETATNGASSTTKSSAAGGKPEVGSKLDLDGFGGDIETNDGTKTTLKKLVDESKQGVVLFTYPRASTPGCTKQACLFRDSFTPLTATGLSIYGLSADSPKANTTFKTKQNLPYTLLCDPSASLIRAIGLAKPGNAKGTVRGVFVVDKSGEVLAAEAGGPDATVDVVRELVKKKGGGGGGGGEVEDKKQAETAGEVADAAEEAGVDGESK